MKHILLLGGYGFIGTNIYFKYVDNHLKDKYRFNVLTGCLLICTAYHSNRSRRLILEIFLQERIWKKYFLKIRLISSYIHYHLQFLPHHLTLNLIIGVQFSANDTIFRIAREIQSTVDYLFIIGWGHIWKR